MAAADNGSSVPEFREYVDPATRSHAMHTHTASQTASAPKPASSSTAGRFCILGAGSSGLAVAKNFRACSITFDCLEREDDVGGNWYFGKPHSSVYQSTRLISSKRGTEYTDFPMPDDWPEHPGHDLVWQYLRSYARQFDLYANIEFNTAVSWIEPAVEAGSGKQRTNDEIRMTNDETLHSSFVIRHLLRCSPLPLVGT